MLIALALILASSTAHARTFELRGDVQWIDQADLAGSPDNAFVLTLRTTLVF